MRILDEQKVNKVLYGGDYNPEQWDEIVKERDMALLGEAGVDIVTINVFAWSMIQPSEDSYDFSELDDTVRRVSEAGMKICMATSTAAVPPWMAKRHPSVLRVGFDGKKRKYGIRHNACPNSMTYRHYSAELAYKLAEHYKDNESIVMWHINNEYGGVCYCENCEKAFRLWLKKKYRTLDALNHAWNTPFWSHVYHEWDEINAPNALSEYPEGYRSQQPATSLDYMRFNTDSIIRNFTDERDRIKSVIPDAECTTNFMEMYKTLDYGAFARQLDVVSWDSYPQRSTEPAFNAFCHDQICGLKGGKPFMLMEQSPGVTNWLPVNSTKRPGQMRLYSYQAMAHCADTVMFFQMRRSPGSAEMYHGAVIDHGGRQDTRIYREVSALGKELEALGEKTLGLERKPKAAMIFDWNTWWAIEDTPGISYRISYPDELMNYYRALYEMRIDCDVIGMDGDFSRYDLILAPLFYMVKEGVKEKIERFVKNGGNIILTTMSGYVDDNCRILDGAYPGTLKDLAGLWVEETDALYEGDENEFVYKGKTYPARIICDVLRDVKGKVLGAFGRDYYSGYPAVTENVFGSGRVFYVGTISSEEFYKSFLADICNELGIKDALIQDADAKRPFEGLEFSVREDEEKKQVYILNFSDSERNAEIPFEGSELISMAPVVKGDILTIEGYGVRIIETTI